MEKVSLLCIFKVWQKKKHSLSTRRAALAAIHPQSYCYARFKSDLQVQIQRKLTAEVSFKWRLCTPPPPHHHPPRVCWKQNQYKQGTRPNRLTLNSLLQWTEGRDREKGANPEDLEVAGYEFKQELICVASRSLHFLSTLTLHSSCQWYWNPLSNYRVISQF